MANNNGTNGKNTRRNRRNEEVILAEMCEVDVVEVEETKKVFELTDAEYASLEVEEPTSVMRVTTKQEKLGDVVSLKGLDKAQIKKAKEIFATSHDEAIAYVETTKKKNKEKKEMDTTEIVSAETTPVVAIEAKPAVPAFTPPPVWKALVEHFGVEGATNIRDAGVDVCQEALDKLNFKWHVTPFHPKPEGTVKAADVLAKLPTVEEPELIMDLSALDIYAHKQETARAYGTANNAYEAEKDNLSRLEKAMTKLENSWNSKSAFIRKAVEAKAKSQGIAIGAKGIEAIVTSNMKAQCADMIDQFKKLSGEIEISKANIVAKKELNDSTFAEYEAAKKAVEDFEK